MSEALRDHLQRTGVSASLMKQLGAGNVVIENRIGNGTGVGQYMPFGEHFTNYTANQKRQEAADYVIDSLDHLRNLQASQKKVRQLPNAKDIKPVLLHEKEMARLGHSIQPYAYRRNPMQKSAFNPAGAAPLQMYKGDLRY